ncbi:MAG: hypothetical protein II817_06445 [Bacteroidales bacterium]|nr:hypothetical protein [Bacteroidales bacterium]
MEFGAIGRFNVYWECEEILGIAEGVALQGGSPQPGHKDLSLKVLVISILRLFYWHFGDLFGVFKNATYKLND